MDLKEKILKENLLSIKDRNIQKNVGDRWMQFNSEKSTVAIYEAMEELSKIVVIAFDIWRVNNGWIRCSNAKHQITYFGVNNRLEKITYTTEQLYELFTQSKEYQELMDGK